MRRLRSGGAFTLIEFLVGIAIFAAMLFPTLSKAKQIQGLNNLRRSAAA